MSRRHTSSLGASLRRIVGTGLTTLLAASVLLPATAVAQGDGNITPRDIQHEWQLLTQRDENDRLEDVPAGVGATMLLRAGAAFGEGACSEYDSSYEQNATELFVFVDPEEISWRECDTASRRFDEQFYENLGRIASIHTAEDILVVNDVIGQRLMVFTRAQIESDPTASRWNLARIGDADGAVQPVIQGLDPWMEFLVGGSVVGNTGCGSFLGKYVTNEARIDITDIHYRLVTCTDGARGQAERVLTTLSEITDFSVRPAGLALEDENGIIRLALEPELDVGSRTWTPTAVYDGNGNQQFGSGNELTTSAIQFRGGDYEGRSICRTFTGNALRSGLAISIGQPTFRDPPNACRGKVKAGPLDQIEGGFITALEAAASVSLRGDELTMTDVDGVVRAVFEPQPPLTGTTWAVFRMYNGKRLAAPAWDVPITATFEDLEAATIGVVQGNTGVSNARDENEYFGTYETPAATRIEVIQLERTGKGCAGKKKSAACKSEARFLKLLQQADGYIVRSEDLKFYDGRRNILVLRPLRLTETEE